MGKKVAIKDAVKSQAEAEAKKIIAQAEKDQDIKAKYKAIAKQTDIDEHGVEHVAYFREPSRLAVGVWLAQRNDNVTTAAEIIFNDTIIQEVSDVAYFQKDAVFNGLLGLLGTLVPLKKSTSTFL
jgi:hypothetical protein